MMAVVRSRAATRSMLLLLAVLLGTGFGGAAAAGKRGLPDFTELVKANSPAVVNISTSQSEPKPKTGSEPRQPDVPDDHPLRDFFDRFFDRQRGQGPGFDGRSLGSGFIISADGLVLTNNHVVANAAEIVVRLSDRREFVADLVGSDPRSDIALLRIDANGLPVVRIGASTALDVGEWVLAIGSPFGFEHSATAGIVSAKKRSLPSESYVPFLQTDVAINPGNSGGPLFNLDGEVVGINSQIYSRTGGFQGVSFAIPIELAMDVADQLQATGSVSRGWLGVVIQDVTRDLAESFDMTRPRGALVAQLLPGSPAERGGLQVGDIIVKYAGREVGTSGALPPMVGRTRVGTEVNVVVIRNGNRRTIPVRIGKLPDRIDRSAAGESARGEVESLAMRVAPVPDKRRAELELGPERVGVVVAGLGDGPAADAGLGEGDVITLLNQQPVAGVEDFVSRVAALPPGSTVTVLVRRGDGPTFIAIPLDPPSD